MAGLTSGRKCRSGYSLYGQNPAISKIGNALACVKLFTCRRRCSARWCKPLSAFGSQSLQKPKTSMNLLSPSRGAIIHAQTPPTLLSACLKQKTPKTRPTLNAWPSYSQKQVDSQEPDPTEPLNGETNNPTRQQPPITFGWFLNGRKGTIPIARKS